MLPYMLVLDSLRTGLPDPRSGHLGLAQEQRKRRRWTRSGALNGTTGASPLRSMRHLAVRNRSASATPSATPMQRSRPVPAVSSGEGAPLTSTQAVGAVSSGSRHHLCQGEGRGFESRRPLRVVAQFSTQRFLGKWRRSPRQRHSSRPAPTGRSCRPPRRGHGRPGAPAPCPP
jgi:hypothetical protein